MQWWGSGTDFAPSLICGVQHCVSSWSRLVTLGSGSPRSFSIAVDSDSTGAIPGAAWESGSVAQRPLPGDHHAVGVIGDAILLVGGLGGGEGTLQTYNATSNAWATSALPWSIHGSMVAAVISDALFACGGILGGTTIRTCYRYAITTRRWTPIAQMPFGVNHAAAGSDGRRLYIFGGRDGCNCLSPGFNYAQIYDPETDRWAHSEMSAPSPFLGFVPAPLPVARGGMGVAVLARGELWVMGGETSIQGSARPTDGVYTRVDIYNPATNTWRAGPPLPFGMHGISPLVLADQAVVIAGGGVQAGFSESKNFLILRLDGDREPTAESTSASVTTTTTTTIATTTRLPTTSATSTLRPSPIPELAGLLPLFRVNAGGGAFVDGQGRAWSADSLFNSGLSFQAQGIPGAANKRSPVQWPWSILSSVHRNEA